jgi:hypothetical protein
MKKVILYSHLSACFSFLFFLTGCEREEIVSGHIALNALEVQLGVVTRASDADGDDPTLTTPNNRRNWVLEVQIEGSSNAEDYVFSEQDEVWIPKSNPAYFPAGVNNNGGCNVTFTLRPPVSPNATIGQDGSAAGLLKADILKSTIKMKPQESHLISLTHANSLIEIAFDSSLENRIVEITLQDNLIHPYPIDNKRYLCIVPSGSNNIALKTKVEEVEIQYALDIDSVTKPNTRYVFIPSIAHSPIISPWSPTTGDDAISEEINAISGVKEFIHIEGYAGVISLMISDMRVRLYPYSNSKKEGESIYYFPSTIDKLEKRTIDSLLLEDYSENILIGRNTNDINPIDLRVDSKGKLSFREARNGNIPINTIGELFLINTALASNSYKQETDIDFSCVSGRNWEPVGSFESPFKGTYDGNGYVIHSMNLDIKQFTAWNPDRLKGPTTHDLEEYYWALPAGVVGLFGVNQGTITNVHITSGTMSISELEREETRSIAFGAICGYNDGGYISYCTNKAKLTVHAISGNDKYKLDIFTVGGICGTSRGSIEYSINYGDITTDEGIFAKLVVGGVCGNLYSRYQTDEIRVNSCINHGDILFKDLTFMPYSSFGCFGGVLGMMHYYHTNGSGFRQTIQHLSNCYNTGDLIERRGTKVAEVAEVAEGAEEAAGIAGDFSGIVAIMFSPLSTYSCNISSCYNIGDIKKLNFNIMAMTLDPVVCAVYDLPELPFPLRLPVENCFYNATPTWEEARIACEGRYYRASYENESIILSEVFDYEKIINEKIVKSSLGFSIISWPTPILWDNHTAWKSLGKWNEGNPIYPKLLFEKD